MRPLQTRVLEAWPDKSVKWLLLDFDTRLPKNTVTDVDIVRAKPAKKEPGVQVSQTAKAVRIRTANLEATINRTSFALFDSYKVGGREMIAGDSDIIIEMPKGKRFYASGARKLNVSVTEKGGQRVVVEATGRHTAGDGSEMFDFRVRYVFRANEPGVALSYKFTNREMPEKGVEVSSMHVVMPTTLGRDSTHHVRQANTGRHWFSRMVEVSENIEICAGGSISEIARKRYGATSEGVIVIRDLESLGENLSDYPHYLRPGNNRTDLTGGLRRVYPWLGATTKDASVVGFFREMGYNYPKGVRCDRGTFTFDIWPESAGLCQVRRGQSKEHDIYIACFDQKRTPEQLEAVYFDREIVIDDPVHITIDRDHAQACEVLQLHRWLRHDEGRYLAVETKLGSAGQFGETAYSPGDVGMFDYGDSVNQNRSWCHNNENDAILHGITEYYRLEAPGRLRGAVVKARHNAHIDFIAFDPDPLREGTMPAHCPEHTDGSTYPSHMWCDGLLAAYCITGNEDFRDAAISVGDNMLRWQKDDPTIFYADSRECGWPALAYCRLYEHTGDKKYLRAIHEVFEHMRDSVNDNAEILYELPHGVGTSLQGYGEFIAWRALYFYWELTGLEEVRRFLIDCLRKVHYKKAGYMKPGWASNDLFPTWALYKLTDDKAVLEENYPFFRFLMERNGGFPWGGVDMHFFLGELDRLGDLEQFA